MAVSGFGITSRGVWGLLAFALAGATPVVVQAQAAPSVTAPAGTRIVVPHTPPRAKRIFDAADRSSRLMDRWNDTRIAAAVEPGLVEALQARGCALGRDPARYFVPAYRAYYDTLRAGFIEQARADRASPQQQAQMAPLLWAVAQLDEAQYQEVLDWFTSAGTREARQYYDLFTAIGDLQSGGLAPGSRDPVYVMLFDFKEAVAAGGLTQPVTAAIRRLDAAQADAFQTVDRNARPTEARRAQWDGLLRWFAANGQALSGELFNHTLSQQQRDAMIGFNHGRYTAAIAAGVSALQAWRAREQAGQPPAGNKELAGREIDLYFGKPMNSYPADPATEPLAWLRTQSARYLEQHKAALCPG